MIFRNLFSGKKEQPITSVADYSALGTDMHSHLIPGIDDGSQTLEDSITLCTHLYELGYRKVITTPHVMNDFYRNSPDTILKGLAVLREAIGKIPEIADLKVEAAAEYYLDEGLGPKIENREVLTFGNDFLLFETSYVNCPDNLDSIVFQIQSNRYKPVLAHPERYPFWYNDFEKYKKLKDNGVYFQLNLNSLCGYYSPAAKKIAEKLIDNNMVEFLGTDTHNTKHTGFLRRTLSEKYLSKLLNSGLLLNGQL